MYNKIQIIYIIVSLLLTVGMLVLGALIKNQKNKDRYLAFWAIITFVIHISVMWVDYLKFGSASAPESVLFPIYFCNACMYLLLIVSLMKKKSGLLFNFLVTFVAYAGTLGALISLFEAGFLADPATAMQWGNLKSMISHSTMLVGCLYIFVGKYTKIGVKNMAPFLLGLVGMGLLGVFNNFLFKIAGLYHPNSMYLAWSPLESAPIFKGPFIALLMIVLVLVFTMIWEMFAYKKGNRWYNQIKAEYNRKTISR